MKLIFVLLFTLLVSSNAFPQETTPSTPSPESLIAGGCTEQTAKAIQGGSQIIAIAMASRMATLVELQKEVVTELRSMAPAERQIATRVHSHLIAALNKMKPCWDEIQKSAQSNEFARSSQAAPSENKSVRFCDQ